MRGCIGLLALVIVWSSYRRGTVQAEFDTLPIFDDIYEYKSVTFTKKLTLSEECSVEMTSDGCILAISPDPIDCLQANIIIDYVKNKISGLGEALSIGSVGDNALNVSDLIVDYFDIDICNQTATLYTSLFDDREITVIPSILSVTGIEIDLSVSIPTNSMTVSFSAIWNLGGVSFSILGDYKNGEYEIFAEPVSQDLSLSTLLGRVSNAIMSGGATGASSLFNELKFNDILLSDMSLMAKFTNYGMGVDFSFTTTFSQLGSTVIALNFNRLKKKEGYDNAVSLAALVKDLSLAAVIKHLSSFDISSVPLIGSLAFPEVAIIGATVDISTLIVDYNIDSDIISLLPAVNKGITFLFSAKFDSETDPMNFMVTFYPPKSMGFRILPGPQLNVKNILNKLLDTVNIQLPHGFPLDEFFNEVLSELTYDGDKNQLTIPVILNDDITIVEDVFELKNTEVDFVIGLATTKTLSFLASGVWMIKNYAIDLAISKQPGASEFLATACSDEPLPVGDVMAKLASSFLPEFASDAFETFGIDFPCFEVLVGKSFGVRVEGTAVIGRFDSSEVEVLGGMVDGAMLMALGVVLQRTKLTSVIYELSNGKVDISSLPGSIILDESSIGIVSSTHELPSAGRTDLKFKLDMLSDIKIIDGVSIVAHINLPEFCAGDIVCKVFQKFFGVGFRLSIKGRLALSDLFLEATLPTDVELVPGFSLSGLGYRLIVRPSMIQVALTASLVIDNPSLTFTGAIGFSSQGTATLDMAMTGCWVKPFRIPIMAICDLYIKTGITPEPTVISELQVGGRAQIGEIDNPKARLFNASLYIGLNKILPSENYFSGQISRLSVPDILAAFAYFPTLPKALEEIAFPDGLDVSYSDGGKTLPNDVTIRSGLRFKGTLQIFQFRASSSMRFDINGVFIHAVASRFNIANDLISVDGDTDIGPELLVNVGWNPPRARIDIQGRVCVVKICRSVNITVDMHGIHFEIEGKFLNLFESKLSLSARYASLNTVAFSVSGYFKQNLLENLKDRVTGAISDLSKTATVALDAAKKELEAAKEKVKDAAEDLHNKKAGVENMQNTIKAKAVQISSQRGKVDELKRKWKESVKKAINELRKFRFAKQEITSLQYKIQSKERVCPTGCNPRKKRAIRRDLRALCNKEDMEANRIRTRKKRFLRFFQRGREAARRMREKARCVAKNLARAACLAPFKTMRVTLEGLKKGLSGLQAAADFALKAAIDKNLALGGAALALKGLEESMNGLAASLEGAKRLLGAAAFVVRKSTIALSAAQLALEGANEAQKAGLKAASVISERGLGGIIEIKELRFDVDLAVANTGEFSGTIVVSFLGGSDETFSFKIKLNSMEDMATILVDKVKEHLKL